MPEELRRCVIDLQHTFGYRVNTLYCRLMESVTTTPFFMGFGVYIKMLFMGITENMERVS